MKPHAGIFFGMLAAIITGVWLKFRDENAEDSVLGGLGDGIMTLLNSITRGSRVTTAKYNAQGVVVPSPESLAAIAEVDVETYSLARNLSSEEGRSSNRIKAAVAHATKNYARKSGRSITSLLTRAQNGAHAGHYGTQKDIDESSANFGNSDRYASTALDPYTGDIEIASKVLDGTIPDETQGAQQYDRPAGESDPDRIAANRIASGAELVMLDGIDDIRFWRT